MEERYDERKGEKSRGNPRYCCLTPANSGLGALADVLAASFRYESLWGPPRRRDRAKKEKQSHRRVERTSSVLFQSDNDTLRAVGASKIRLSSRHGVLGSASFSV